MNLNGDNFVSFSVVNLRVSPCGHFLVAVTGIVHNYIYTGIYVYNIYICMKYIGKVFSCFTTNTLLCFVFLKKVCCTCTQGRRQKKTTRTSREHLKRERERKKKDNKLQTNNETTKRERHLWKIIIIVSTLANDYSRILMFRTGKKDIYVNAIVMLYIYWYVQHWQKGVWGKTTFLVPIKK